MRAPRDQISRRGLFTLPLVAFAAAKAQQPPHQTGVFLAIEPGLFSPDDKVRLEPCHPVPAGIALAFDQPWEGNTSAYASLFEDNGRYRMYYRGSAGSDYADKAMLTPGEKLPTAHPEFTCYAESSNGITWEKPKLNRHAFAGSKANNILLADSATHNFAPFLDTNPAASSESRYKAVAANKRVLMAYQSADGMDWRPLQSEPILTDGYFDSLNLAFWSDSLGQYLAVYRDFQNGVRWIKTAVSNDFRQWKSNGWIHANLPPTHLYTNAAQPYFRCPRLLLAFPNRFIHWRKPHSTNPIAGVSDSLFLVASRPTAWTQLFPEAYITPGPDQRNWVHRANMVAPRVIRTGPAEMSLYVSRHYTFPTAHLERMTLRLDGFGAWRASAAEGTLTTSSLRVKGRKLVLNYATSAAGALKVSIRKENGQPLPGWDFDDHPPLFGDEVERAIELGDSQARLIIENEPVRLHFRLKEASLYSFDFRD